MVVLPLLEKLKDFLLGLRDFLDHARVHIQKKVLFGLLLLKLLLLLLHLGKEVLQLSDLGGLLDELRGRFVHLVMLLKVFDHEVEEVILEGVFDLALEKFLELDLLGGETGILYVPEASLLKVVFLHF